MQSSKPAPDKAAAVWKAALVAFVLFALAHDLTAVFHWQRSLSGDRIGTLGWTRGPWSSDGYLVQGLAPGSPLAAAGAKAGDRVAFDHPGDRMRHLSVDENVGLTLTGADGARHVSVRPARGPGAPALQVATMAAEWAASLMMLVVGALIGWRRPERLATRMLSASLLSQTLVVFLALLPGGAFQSFSLRVLQPLLGVAAYDCFLYFVLAYTGVISRRWVWRAFVAFVTADVLVACWIAASMPPASLPLAALARSVGEAFGVASATVCIGALFAGWWRARGVHRQRLAWLCLCLGALYAVYALSLLPIGGEAWRSAFPLVAALVVGLANAGLGYAVLRHRILDFGFAVNRALVYAATSVVLAGLFIACSQLVNGLIRFDARAASPVMDMAIALGLALTARHVVRKIDPHVRRLFYRRWHEEAARLRAFRIERLHGLATEALVPALLEALRAYAHAESAAFYVCEGAGRLRRQEGALEGVPDVLGADEPVDSALAIPMSAQERILGVVLLGPKADGDPYRPDEVTELTTSIHHVGIELELRRLRALEKSLGTNPA